MYSKLARLELTNSCTAFQAQMSICYETLEAETSIHVLSSSLSLDLVQNRHSLIAQQHSCNKCMFAYIWHCMYVLTIQVCACSSVESRHKVYCITRFAKSKHIDFLCMYTSLSSFRPNNFACKYSWHKEKKDYFIRCAQGR